jgi:hypothetical protein
MRRDPQEYRTDADARCEYAALPDTTARLRRRDDLDVDWGCFRSLYFMGISLKNPRLTLPDSSTAVARACRPNGLGSIQATLTAATTPAARCSAVADRFTRLWKAFHNRVFRTPLSRTASSGFGRISVARRWPAEWISSARSGRFARSADGRCEPPNRLARCATDIELWSAKNFPHVLCCFWCPELLGAWRGNNVDDDRW